MFQRSANLIILGALLATHGSQEQVLEVHDVATGAEIQDNIEVCNIEQDSSNGNYESEEKCSIEPSQVIPDSAKTDLLLEELLEAGGELNKLKVHEFSPGNNGLVATEDIKAGEIACFIP